MRRERMRVHAACLLYALLSASPAASARVEAPRDAAGFNGTWQMSVGPYAGELKLWAVDERTLRAEFQGFFYYQTVDDRMANLGEAIGTAVVDGDKASFTPRGSEGECVITLHLLSRGWMQAGQSGGCGFGWRVTAAGRYKRLYHGRPWFELSAAPPSDPGSSRTGA